MINDSVRLTDVVGCLLNNCDIGLFAEILSKQLNSIDVFDKLLSK